MNIDERLDRLAERHEALSQTVELVAHAQERNEQEIARLLQMQSRHDEAQAKNETLMAQMLEKMGQMMESITGLARVANEAD